jgi:DNA-binding GntR family transcriptional regulator
MATVSKVEPLVDALRTRILAGEFDAGRLPSFRTLGAEYNTTQETMNKVMQSLQAEGVLISQGTKGVFVNNLRIRVPETVADFYEDVLKSHDSPVNAHIEKPEIISATQELAEKMNIKKGSKILRRYRKQGTGNSVFRLVEAYFPISLLNEDILKQIHENPNFHIINAIKEFSGKTIHFTHEELFARLPTIDEQKQLNIVRSNPVIDTKITHYMEDKKTVIFYTRKILNANLFLLTFDYSTDYWK